MSIREPGVQVEFFLDKVLQGAESVSSGREIYKDEPHVRIRVAGQDKSEVVRQVTAKDRARFPEEWAAFERGMEAPAHGTPIEQWGRVTPSLARTLRNLNIRTVEDLATLSDAGVTETGPGGFKLREDARKFLSLSQASADLSRLEELEKSNKEKDEALAAQGKQMAELEAKVAKLMVQEVPLMPTEPVVAVVSPAEPPRRRKQAA